MMTEGEVWKGKRKSMSSFFNFNKVKGNIPTILAITDKKLESIKKERK